MRYAEPRDAGGDKQAVRLETQLAQNWARISRVNRDTYAARNKAKTNGAGCLAATDPTPTQEVCADSPPRIVYYRR